MVSQSAGRVVREKRPTGPYTASPIPPSQRRDLERARLYLASLIILSTYIRTPTRCQELFVRFNVKQTALCLMSKYEQHTSLLSWHDESPAWPVQAVNLRSPKGAPKAQRLTANARAKRQSACHEAVSLARLGMRSSLLLVAPTKACSINPHAMEDHSDLASHRHLGALHAAPLGDRAMVLGPLLR
jgi:hypothetical protein